MNWKRSRHLSFVNPYNFISLEGKPERVSIESIRNRSDFLTGFLECELETRTPVFIPNTTNDKVFHSLLSLSPEDSDKVKSYDFFSYQDLSQHWAGIPDAPEPIIPGSEIRGMIRSAYEALTNSCLSTVVTDGILYQRTNEVAKNMAFLRKKGNKWFLYEADVYRVKVGKNGEMKENCNWYKMQDGQKVYFKVTQGNIVEISLEEKTGFDQCGYFHKGEPFGMGTSEEKALGPLWRKKYERIFVEKENSEPVQIHESVYEKLMKLFQIYRDEKNNHHRKNGHSGYEGSQAGNRDFYLVYYVKLGDRYYLSPAQMSKQVFYRNIGDILDQQGEYSPCKSVKTLCPACRLFGMVSGDGAIASRIRFTDAHLIEEERKKDRDRLFMPISILNELSSPKISATEFYLVGNKDSNREQKLSYWNYDYAFTSEGKLLQNYQPMLRGRKFYWHSKWQSLNSDLKNGKVNEFTHLVRPLAPFVKFKFYVYFDGISQEELEQLIWTLNIGSNENSHCHKIGMGKPLGLGSVKIRVRNVMNRRLSIGENGIERKVEPMNIHVNGLKPFDETKRYVREFLKITDYDSCPVNVSYPRAVDKTTKDTEEQVYHWFVANRGMRQAHNRPKFNQELPTIIEDRISLDGYIKFNRKNIRKKRN